MALHPYLLSYILGCRPAVHGTEPVGRFADTQTSV